MVHGMYLVQFQSVFILLLLCPALLHACVLCSNQGMPLSKEVAGAKLVVFGRITDSRLAPDGIKGTSDFQIEKILQGDRKEIAAGKLTLPRYVPPVPGIRYIIFLDINQGQVDPYRSIECTTDRLVSYLQNMPKLTGLGTPSERQARLKYTFDFFQDSEPEIANDAYKEWSIAQNEDVANIAGQLDAAKLRRWVVDSKTPQHCLALYAYLLGACGNRDDFALLKRLIDHPPDARYATALDGILCGIERQDAAAAWLLVQNIAKDEKRNFSEKHALLRFIKFMHAVRKESVREKVSNTLVQFLSQLEMMDLAIEQMRVMKCWDTEQAVFKLYQQNFESVISKRAIIRYALSNPSENARKFTESIRARDPQLVSEMEEQLKWMQGP